ncbi:MAG: dihydrolipoyl dehydrogenase [Armatimonadetes bacterium]|nr:dihydrolipoyl dehydrogenase [Armatimonadota bacterium]
MATHQTDCVVIGAGPGGYVAAIKLAQLGVKTIVVERDRLGGTCLNYGCIPSKALIHAGKTVDNIREHAAEMGIKVSDPEVDMPQLIRWKDSVVKKLTGGIGQLFKANGVQETIYGDATFRSPREIEVKAADGTSHTIHAPNSIIATGGRPFELPNIPFDYQDIISSKEALELQELPRRTVVIGGGIIGLEIGTFLQKLGSKVTVVEMTDTLLPGIDPDLVAVVARKLKKRGVKVHLKSKAQSVSRNDDGSLKVTVETPEGALDLEADKVLVAVGWKPYTGGLGLENIGVVMERGFVKTDDALRTNVEGIRAIGDVAGGPLLAHKASKEGIIAAESIAGMPTAKDWRAMPAAVFCDPEIATVGLTVAQAKEAGYEVLSGKFPFTANGRALGSNEGEGYCQIVAEKGTGCVLGMHVVGPEASNLIAEGALGIEMGAVVEDLALTVHTHPTLPEAIMEAAEATLGHAIHAVSR